MKIKLFASSLILLMFVLACNTNSPKESTNIDATQVSTYDLSKGFNLAESYCFTCHSPNASIDNRIAPPMVAVKKHYISENTSEEDFLRDLIQFVNNPSEDISKMPGAIAKFNLMPKMSFSEEDLGHIAHYIYNTEIEQPDWFEEHYQQEKKKYGQQKNEGELSDLEQGQQYAMATKAILGKNLIEAINQKGTAEALSFCNTKAIHLTDSMAMVQGVEIKRVSDQERNPDNKANAEELAYIQATKAKINAGEKPSPQITDLDDKVIAYYPILTNAMCLQCHGQKESDVQAETLAKLNALYPGDKATGYGENELRGIWVVEMPKQ